MIRSGEHALFEAHVATGAARVAVAALTRSLEGWTRAVRSLGVSTAEANTALARFHAASVAAGRSMR